MASYTPTGPWTSGGAPGVDAPFLNALEAFLATLTPASVSISGQTSGTATLYEYVFGTTMKKVIVNMVNYRNSAAQTLTLPTAFTDHAYVQVCETWSAQIAFRSGGSSVTSHIITSIALGGGTQSSQSFFKQWSSGVVDGGFDSIQLGTGMTAAINSLIIVDGI